MPEIAIRPHREPPFDVELTVFEEDTWMVLSAGNFARESRRSTEDLVDDMREFEPRCTGELVVKGNRAFAIVHDLDHTPSCDDTAIDAALDALFDYCRDNHIRAIAMQPLGCVHAKGSITGFVDRLRAHAGAGSVERIWVVA